MASFPLRAARILVGLAVWIILVIWTAWCVGAVIFDFPIKSGAKLAATVFLLLLLGLIYFVRGGTRKAISAAALLLALTICWRTIKPSNERPWQPDVAQLAWADINGDQVTIHNIRNCDYRSETDYTAKWETRTVNLNQLREVDVAITWWGSPYIAHPIASFQFADSPPICFSIEARKEIGESYSAIGGFYRQYELVYVCADESDVIKLRTNYRHGEDVYLYRVLNSPGRVRTRFLDYLGALNRLRDHPRWYNAATTNCTTSIRAQHDAKERLPWDWRILVNGKMDEMMYERKLIASAGLPFAELKQRSWINERAQAAGDGPDFSRKIREGLPESGQ